MPKNPPTQFCGWGSFSGARCVSSRDANSSSRDANSRGVGDQPKNFRHKKRVTNWITWYVLDTMSPHVLYVFRGVWMVNSLVFRWPKPLFFMVLGAQSCHIHYIYHPWIVWKIPFPFTTDVMASPWHRRGYPEMYFFLFLDPRDFRDTMGYPY